jgi:hypothetical protein
MKFLTWLASVVFAVFAVWLAYKAYDHGRPGVLGGAEPAIAMGFAAFLLLRAAEVAHRIEIRLYPAFNHVEPPPPQHHVPPAAHPHPQQGSSG